MIDLVSVHAGARYFFLLVYMFCICTSIETMEKEDSGKVEIELYYVPQCPGCKQLITTSFREAFATPGFSDMADVTFVSYGNVRTMKGSLRIFDNVLESCALNKIDHQEKRYQFIECVDYSQEINKDAHQVDTECAKIIGLNHDTVRKIEVCAATKEGHVLANKMAEKSNSVIPEIKYYPWILVNGIHNSPIETEVWNNLFTYTCKIYEGSNKSPHCPGESIQDLLTEQL